MKKNIAIITTSVGNFGKFGFYNMQEIGLAKALSRFCNRVDFYRCIDRKDKRIDKLIECTKNAYVHLIPSMRIGSNGFFNIKELNPNTNIIINCTDTQLNSLNIYEFAKRNKIEYYPYVGVLYSHNTNKIISWLLNLVSRRNYVIYRNSICFAKTTEVCNRLINIKAKKVINLPVALDINLLYTSFEDINKRELKLSLGFDDNVSYIIFVGRLVKEKKPIEIIKIYERIKKINNGFKLIMIGSGELEQELKWMINHEHLENDVNIIKDVPYNEMWKYYYVSDYFINLNSKEIFGMALLEAMYYKNTVIAYHAPGPNDIIVNNDVGFLVKNDEEIIKLVAKGEKATNSNRYILTNFSWDSRANLLNGIMNLDA